MKLNILFVAAAVAIGSLSACQGSNTVTPGPSTPPAAAGPEPTQTTATPTPRAKTVGAFGDTITYPSAIAVKVSPGRVVPSSQTGMGAIEGKIVVFDLAVTNGGTEPIEGSMMGRPKVSYSAQGIEAQSAYDFALGNSGGSLSTILPGETQTVTVAYGIPTASFGDVRMEVHSANYSDPPAIFKGAVH